MLAGAGGIAGVSAAAFPAAASAVIATDGITIDQPGTDSGKMFLRDYGTLAPVGPGVPTNNFRISRADGAGYLSNNAFFTPDAGGGTWTQDNGQGMTVIEEFGEGNWGIFMAPAYSQTPIARTELVTVLNSEFMDKPAITGPQVVQVPQGRLFVGVTHGALDKSVIDASLRVISTQPSIRPFYVQGGSSVLAQFRANTRGAKALALFNSGPDENNASYLAMGVDPTGSQIGYGSGGSFVSAGSNGPDGTPQNLILHIFENKDVVVATGNAEKLRFPSQGGIKMKKSSTAPTGATDSVVLFGQTNSSGKSQLVARFGTGADVVVATEA